MRGDRLRPLGEEPLFGGVSSVETSRPCDLVQHVVGGHGVERCAHALFEQRGRQLVRRVHEGDAAEVVRRRHRVEPIQVGPCEITDLGVRPPHGPEEVELSEQAKTHLVVGRSLRRRAGLGHEKDVTGRARRDAGEPDLVDESRHAGLNVADQLSAEVDRVAGVKPLGVHAATGPASGLEHDDRLGLIAQ